VPPPDDPGAVRHSGWARWQPFFAYVLPCLFAVVIGALAAGWATPAECAALDAFATIVFALLYRAFSWAALLRALKGTANISGIILSSSSARRPSLRFFHSPARATAWCS